MWRGLRLLETPLQRAREAGIPIRVITTTYIGGTEREALDRLVRDFGAEVRIQYDAARTRLHAKAWLFRRKTGFDTAYVGSSNLSTSAPARRRRVERSPVRRRQRRACSPSSKQPSTPTGMRQSSSHTTPTGTVIVSTMPWQPRGQSDVAIGSRSPSPAWRSGRSRTSRRSWTRIDVERRVHDRHRNLVVAATGTGKTVIAALDYRRLCVDGASALDCCSSLIDARSWSSRCGPIARFWPTATFGELYVGGSRPERWEHVFASVQSLTSYGVDNIPAEPSTIVVIDEFHHAEARTYRRVLDHWSPPNSSASPQRRNAPTASTCVPSSRVGRPPSCAVGRAGRRPPVPLPLLRRRRRNGPARSWPGRAAATTRPQLDNLFTGNDARAAHRPAATPRQGHRRRRHAGSWLLRQRRSAEYMARSSTRPESPRARSAVDASRRTRPGADGSACPATSTFCSQPTCSTRASTSRTPTRSCFLRPTESATIFLQQLGRGLRRTRDKAVLTVLDFVGYHRKEFRFDLKLRAITGDTRARHRATGRAKAFPSCRRAARSQMDRQAQTLVLENIRSQIANVATDRRRTASPLRGRPRRLPRGVGHRTERHPPSRKSLVDTAKARRRTPDCCRIRTRGGAAQACARLRACRRSRPSDGLCPPARRRRPGVRRTVCHRAATRAHALQLTVVRRRWLQRRARRASRRCNAKRPHAARSRRWSTCPSMPRVTSPSISQAC